MGDDRPVIVGTCLLRLHLPEAGSLKDKRQVVTSLASRLRNRYGVSVAEIADVEAWQIATLGVACVSSREDVCRRLLDEIVRWVEGTGLGQVIEATVEVR